MNPETELSPPLALDEAVRLAAFLAERGHTDAAFQVLGVNICRAATTAMSEEVTA